MPPEQRFTSIHPIVRQAAASVIVTRHRLRSLLLRSQSLQLPDTPEVRRLCESLVRREYELVQVCGTYEGHDFNVELDQLVYGQCARCRICLLAIVR
jgi:hypothetical protein